MLSLQVIVLLDRSGAVNILTPLAPIFFLALSFSLSAEVKPCTKYFQVNTTKILITKSLLTETLHFQIFLKKFK